MQGLVGNLGGRILSALLLGAVVLSAASAVAQDRQGGPERLSAEDAQAAWRLEGISVARDLGIERPQGEKVVDAYLAARASYDKAREELMGGVSPSG